MTVCERCGQERHAPEEISAHPRARVCFACSRKRHAAWTRKRRRERMASDPEYRERERARQRDYARKRWQ
ncbi:MAG TPA: hypothetical protein VK631_23850, partial [Solirubrobacteraceae bacterium]|nr:hypothetical protein [Solirubrobacteraceae bacterium]